MMELADRFGLPVLSLVDTAGAYPGVGAEERGQAEAIARSTEACLSLGMPNVAVIIGEGGSGGAIAIATANRAYMLEHADLQRDLARRRRLDPVARFGARPGRRDRHEDHRGGSARPEGHRRHHRGAARRRAPRPRRGDRPARARSSPGRSPGLPASAARMWSRHATRKISRHRPVNSVEIRVHCGRRRGVLMRRAMPHGRSW